MMDSDSNVFFDNCIDLWWENLCNLVSEIESRGKKPVFVAISRKMPRLIRWITEDHHNAFMSDSNNDEGKRLVELLKENLITELALPFVAFNENVNDLEFIILDDLIVHGTTLRTVYENINNLFDQKAHIACIFRHYKANIADFLESRDLSGIVLLTTQDDVDDVGDRIAEIVNHNQLPIDMEFPIFRIPLPLEDTIESLKGVDTKNCYYTEREKTFTYNLKEKKLVGENVDFCKLRFFGKADKTVFEVFSPLTIAESDILSTDRPLFGETIYTAIWENLTRRLRISMDPSYGQTVFCANASLAECSIRSLVVIANYLYSLSALVINADEIFPFSIRRSAVLCKRELCLLVGKTSAESIYNVLNSLLGIGDTVVSQRGRYLNIPEAFAPRNFQREIEGIKITAAIMEDAIADVFDKIFSYLHYTNPKFDNPYIAYERLFFGETHNSLADAVSVFFDEDVIEQETHKWVDENIDAGFIIPKYERIKSKDEGYFWRRFFHAGIRRKKTEGKESI